MGEGTNFSRRTSVKITKVDKSVFALSYGVRGKLKKISWVSAIAGNWFLSLWKSWLPRNKVVINAKHTEAKVLFQNINFKPIFINVVNTVIGSLIFQKVSLSGYSPTCLVVLCSYHFKKTAAFAEEHPSSTSQARVRRSGGGHKMLTSAQVAIVEQVRYMSFIRERHLLKLVPGFLRVITRALRKNFHDEWLQVYQMLFACSCCIPRHVNFQFCTARQNGTSRKLLWLAWAL